MSATTLPCPYCAAAVEIGVTGHPEDYLMDHITDEHQEMMPKVICNWEDANV